MSIDKDESELTLDNCDREPIHIPGSVQPHGALIAFDRLGRISHASSNVEEMLGFAPAFGARIRSDAFVHEGNAVAAVYSAITAAIADEASTGPAFHTFINGHPLDVVLHRHDDRLICEFERRDSSADVSAFAQLAFTSLNQLKRSTSIKELLDNAVIAVREITGFDRVMAYRFAHDDSGEIVSEAKADHLEAFLGRRYPATDIPAQARRLYTINTLRLIADVAYEPVGLLAAPAETRPLDLSYSVLRSVSPVHVEYLTNMGVRGSMSVSIVIGGKLWGMLACHHGSSKLVPYPIRMAVDVTAHVTAATIQSLIAHRRESMTARAAMVRTDFAAAILGGTEMLQLVRRDRELLLQTLACDNLLLIQEGSCRVFDGVDPGWANDVAQWLSTQKDSMVQVLEASHLPPWPDSVPRESRYCGALALRYDPGRGGWLVALRRERVLTIRWGGKPDKVIKHGPLGPRLTPRGSFDEWRETVRDTASPWSSIQREIASQLLDAITRAHMTRVVEQETLRAQVWAMLGHDLRSPLQSINMANVGIERGLSPERLNTVIRNSTLRMNRIVADVLDLSRLQHGGGLTITPQPIDLAELLRQLLEEMSVAHPEAPVVVDMPASLAVQGDPGRLAQLFSNLLSNARHHGRDGIRLQAWQTTASTTVVVSNLGDPIPDALAHSLFDPFKRTSMSNQRNRTGMGLGLYIASQIAIGHGAGLSYSYDEGHVKFTFTLPSEP